MAILSKNTTIGGRIPLTMDLDFMPDKVTGIATVVTSGEINANDFMSSGNFIFEDVTQINNFPTDVTLEQINNNNVTLIVLASNNQLCTQIFIMDSFSTMRHKINENTWSDWSQTDSKVDWLMNGVRNKPEIYRGLSTNSVASKSSTAGTKAYKISSFINNNDGTATCKLNTVDGLTNLNFPQECWVSLNNTNVENIDTVSIESISGNTLTLSNVPNLYAFEDESNTEELHNYLMLCRYPERGDIEVNVTSIAYGDYTKATMTGSSAFGLSTWALAEASHAEGFNTCANRTGAHAEGFNTLAEGKAAHAEGVGTQSTNTGSHTEGMSTTAIGKAAHAEGDSTDASGIGAHSEGYNTIAAGDASHAGGYETLAYGLGTTAIGRFNDASEDAKTAAGEFGKYVFVIGNGTSIEDRKNAFTVDWEGNVVVQKSIKVPTIEVEKPSIILTSPNGSKFKLKIGDNGALITEAIN